MKRPRVPHQLRPCGRPYKFHCVRCEKYFYREPKAYTCPGAHQSGRKEEE